jgi:hypothetical protein
MKALASRPSSTLAVNRRAARPLAAIRATPSGAASAQTTVTSAAPRAASS